MALYALQFLIPIKILFNMRRIKLWSWRHIPQSKYLCQMELVSANSRLFSTTELRLSTILRDFSPIIYALSEYEILTQGTQHPIFFIYWSQTYFIFVHTEEQANWQSVKTSVNIIEVSKLTHSLDWR